MASSRGKQNPSGSRFKPDKLDREQLKALYDVTAAQLAIDDDLFNVFEQAFQGKWDKNRFRAALEQTDWWRSNSKSMRDYLLAAADPENIDFQNLQEDSFQYVMQTAAEVGSDLAEEDLRDLARQSLMMGWGDPSQKYELERAILQRASRTPFSGTVGQTAADLKALARANGVQYNDAWFESAGVSVASRKSNPDFWAQKIRAQAASMFPVFADQIEAGLNVYDIASPYIRTMAEEWDMNPNAISLNDSTILGALTNYTDKGQPFAMNLGEFRTKLRNDPRWLNTDKAQNEITSIASQVMAMFGLRG